MPYTVDFENDGSVAAQDVTVTEQLDVSLDWSTFQLGSFGFGTVNVTIPAGLTSYQTTITYQNTNGSSLNVEVALNFNVETGLLTVTFTSLDPATGQAPTGVFDGFLPPDNSSHIGEGYIQYTVQSKANLTTGTTINQQAAVVFDTNAPITTNTVTNTIDAGPPSSSVQPLPASMPTPSFTVTWSGQDDADGSGIASYDIYVSDNGGPVTPWLTDTTLTSALYTGQNGHTYGFSSVATDNVGNRQATPATAQATTQVVVPLTVSIAAVASPRNSAVSSLTITFNEAVTGFVMADLQLQRDGGAVPLSGATLTSSDNLTWTLGNLASLTDPTQHWDNYTLTLTAAGSGIIGPASNPLTNNASTAFTVLDPALSLAGNTLTVQGTTGNDTFTFTAGTPDVITLNGVSYNVDPAVTAINFTGNGGTDSATLTGLGNDFAELYPHTARFAAISNAYIVNVGNVANITVHSSGVNSLTYFHTSDTFTGNPLLDSARDGSTYDNVAVGFRHNDCFAGGSGAIANLGISGTGADEFGGVPTFSFVQGPSDSYDSYAVGFAQVVCAADGNTAAQAFLGMSTGMDTYTCDDVQHTDTIQGAGGAIPSRRLVSALSRPMPPVSPTPRRSSPLRPAIPSWAPTAAIRC